MKTGFLHQSSDWLGISSLKSAYNVSSGMLNWTITSSVSDLIARETRLRPVVRPGLMLIRHSAY